MKASGNMECWDSQEFSGHLFSSIYVNVNVELACLSRALQFWATWMIKHNVGHFQRSACCAVLFLLPKAQKTQFRKGMSMKMVWWHEEPAHLFSDKEGDILTKSFPKSFAETDFCHMIGTIPAQNKKPREPLREIASCAFRSDAICRFMCFVASNAHFWQRNQKNTAEIRAADGRDDIQFFSLGHLPEHCPWQLHQVEKMKLRFYFHS